MMTRLAIAGYRSLRDIRVSLAALNVVTGANGSGKSSLYRALRLLADIAQGRIIQSLAGEGGLHSTLWAGPEVVFARDEGRQPVQGTRAQGAGQPEARLRRRGLWLRHRSRLAQSSRIALRNDPAIKAESLWTGERLAPRPTLFAVRNGPACAFATTEASGGRPITHLAPFDSMMTHCSDPREALELLLLRERMRDWRFYDHFRTDRDAPARRPQIGTYTPVLGSDGSDLAAAVATIREIGDRGRAGRGNRRCVSRARASTSRQRRVFEIEMRQHGLLRPLKAAELSDGTLRYLLLVAALLSPRPPALMILNEPETSLHPDLLPPLARLIVQARRAAQVIVVSHAPILVAHSRRRRKAGRSCSRSSSARPSSRT